MKKIFIILIILINTVGCTNKKTSPTYWQQPLQIPDGNIIFQTIKFSSVIENVGKEVIGFYNFDTGKLEFLDLGSPLITPFFLGTDKIIAIDKLGNQGSINEFSGNIYIFNNKYYIWCDSPVATGWWIHTYGDSILINSDSGINLIRSSDCSLISTILSKSQISTLFGTAHINSYSLSRDRDFIIIESTNKLFKADLTDMTILDYKINGANPAISPNQQQIAYIGSDGIYVMNITGKNNILISQYADALNYLINGIFPKPIWSNDGKKLIYHKCINVETTHFCMNINDYSIFIYDLDKQTETKIIDGGINPSWR